MMNNDSIEHETGQESQGPNDGGTPPPGPERQEGGSSVDESVHGDENQPVRWDRSPLAKRQFRLSQTWLNVLVAFVTLVVCIAITATYLSKVNKRLAVEDAAREQAAMQSTEGKVSIKVFYPSPSGLVSEDRWVVPSALQTRMVENAVLEYLKGPSEGAVSYIPEGTQLLGLFSGSDGIIYLDLSHEFRSSFQGDAYEEFLLLRGLYESVMSNADDVSGLKVLIEGNEVDTIGGHISLQGTLGSAVASTVLEGYAGK
jgi:hypothetical protein